MTSLTPEQIKALLTKQPKARKSKAVDTSIRDYATWFKLAPKAMDEEQASYQCENLNCLDDRPAQVTATGITIKVQFTADISGVRMCRRCFLDGWLLADPEQLEI